jgi:hypothetical protein
MAEKIFTNGLIFKAPNAKAPDYVKGTLSVKVEDFKAFLDEHSKNGWVNISLKEAKSGKYYAELDTWEPNRAKKGPEEVPEGAQEAPGEEINADDIPF